jgi:hypothetical protein
VLMVWSMIERSDVANMAIQLVVLVGTALGVGLIGQQVRHQVAAIAASGGAAMSHRGASFPLPATTRTLRFWLRSPSPMAFELQVLVAMTPTSGTSSPADGWSCRARRRRPADACSASTTRAPACPHLERRPPRDSHRRRPGARLRTGGIGPTHGPHPTCPAPDRFSPALPPPPSIARSTRPRPIGRSSSS